MRTSEENGVAAQPKQVAALISSWCKMLLFNAKTVVRRGWSYTELKNVWRVGFASQSMSGDE